MLKFGEVFRWREKEYVFLAATPDILYAALILDRAESDQLSHLYEIRVVTSKDESLKHPLYIFVTLSTPEFKDRLAHFHQTQHELFPGIQVVNIVLTSKDKSEIQKEILNPKSSLPKELKNLISNLVINQ